MCCGHTARALVPIHPWNHALCWSYHSHKRSFAFDSWWLYILGPIITQKVILHHVFLDKRCWNHHWNSGALDNGTHVARLTFFVMLAAVPCKPTVWPSLLLERALFVSSLLSVCELLWPYVGLIWQSGWCGRSLALWWSSSPRRVLRRI